MRRFWAERAWLGGAADRAEAGVLVEVDGGRFATVTPGVGPPPDAVRLAGLTVPGLANAHSHAFHRALRGRTHDAGGTFWTWRDRMYALAGRLSPDQVHALARAVYAEMALAGVVCVGEFHYLHHAPGGRPYADPNEMSHRLLAAAAEAGIRITLLDTLVLTSTVDGAPLAGAQLRFGDGDLDAWSSRRAGLRPPPHAMLGAAAHSVRAVPADVLGRLAERTRGEPVHVHVSEQPAENAACLAVHGRTPTRLLHDTGLTGPGVTAIHATHASPADVDILGRTGTGVCLCPTTERDLADGIGPGADLARAGAPLSLGSDSQAVVDLLEEARAVELHERLRQGRRGVFEPAELWRAGTAGHAALGWSDAGRIAPGARADLVTLRLDSVRTAGLDDPLATVFTATAPDVSDVVVDGRDVVRDGRHRLLADPSGALAAAIAGVWR
jgi:formiminoglutamate deiminase